MTYNVERHLSDKFHEPAASLLENRSPGPDPRSPTPDPRSLLARRGGGGAAATAAAPPPLKRRDRGEGVAVGECRAGHRLRLEPAPVGQHVGALAVNLEPGERVVDDVAMKQAALRLERGPQIVQP